jgi:hypothetical protein
VLKHSSYRRLALMRNLEEIPSQGQHSADFPLALGLGKTN